MCQHRKVNTLVDISSPGNGINETVQVRSLVMRMRQGGVLFKEPLLEQQEALAGLPPASHTYPVRLPVGMMAWDPQE